MKREADAAKLTMPLQNIAPVQVKLPAFDSCILDNGLNVAKCQVAFISLDHQGREVNIAMQATLGPTPETLSFYFHQKIFGITFALIILSEWLQQKTDTLGKFSASVVTDCLRL